MLYSLLNLVDYVNRGRKSAAFPNDLKPHRRAPLRWRICNAWAVLTGQAEAFEWPKST